MFNSITCASFKVKYIKNIKNKCLPLMLKLSHFSMSVFTFHWFKLVTHFTETQ